MISDTELIKLQQDRQAESDYVLEQIQLIPLLQKYGQVNIVGAKAMGLMINKDIDIAVILDELKYDTWQKVVSELMVTPNVRKVTAIDYYNYTAENIYDPEHGQKYSLYIEMDTLMGRSGDKYDTWECQIHLQDKTAFNPQMIKSVTDKLTPTNIITILRIKYWANQINKSLLKKSNGHFKIQSTDIYPLVLNGSVTTIEQFIPAYLPTVPEKFRQLCTEEVSHKPI